MSFVNKANSNENNNIYIKFLEAAELQLSKHWKIIEEHLDKYGLHLSRACTQVLARKLILKVQYQVITKKDVCKISVY